jgi:hypothetical protein
MAGRPTPGDERETARLLEPKDVEELLRGWLLHVHKSRDRHETAARRFEDRRTRFGILAVSFSALGSSSVVVSLVTRSSDEGSANVASTVVAVIAAVLTLIGGVFAGLQSFLNYAGRAADHHTASVSYKAIVRELEQTLTGSWTLDPEASRALVDNLRRRLDALEKSSPVVDGRDWNSVERTYRDIHLVERAIDLSPARDLPEEDAPFGGSAAPSAVPPAIEVSTAEAQQKDGEASGVALA